MKLHGISWVYKYFLVHTSKNLCNLHKFNKYMLNIKQIPCLQCEKAQQDRGTAHEYHHR